MGLSVSEFILKQPSDGMIMLAELSKADKWPLKVTVKEAGKRSLDANSLQHVWYRQIADFTGETKERAENFCKLEFGLPILLSRGDKVAEMISVTLERIRFLEWRSHEMQVDYMSLFMVTRLMSAKEHKKYRDDIQFFYSEKGLYLDYL